MVEAEESADLWREVRDVASLQGKPGEIWRLACLPTDAARIVAQIEGDAVWDWGGGLVWLLTAPFRGAEVAAAVAGRGHATLIRGEGGPVFSPEAPEVAALVAGVKAKFDPKAILNRGMMG